MDDDNDGILDTVEGTTDTDNDGIPNLFDLDSDNDGIADIIEAGGIDADGDGHIDYPIPGDATSINDANNDGFDDEIAINPLPDNDFDNDGIQNRLDLDSDGDGISDLTEAGGIDSDSNGLIDGFTDTNENGLDEDTEATSLPLPNSDMNPIDGPDYLDIDADDDGLPDNIEAQPTFDYQSPEATSLPNGFNTAYPQSIVPEDSDRDSIPDYRDTDSDNDELSDAVEGDRGFFIRSDADGDGLVNGFEGSEINDPEDVNDEIEDPTLLPDVQSPGGDVDYRQNAIPDSDGDGVTDAQEIADGTDPDNPCDFEMPSITETQTEEYLSADCDGDGVTNGDEIEDGTNPEDPCGAMVSSSSLVPTGDYLISDCDGDGVTNGDEREDGTDPLDPCDFLEENITVGQSGNWLIADCDGDQIQNGREIEDGTDPSDPCSSIGGRPPTDSPCDISIRTEFIAPGVNSGIFWITNIESYPDNSVRIYNRWGKLVYETSNYDNSGNAFRGISNGDGAIIKDDALPVGVYFYVIEYQRMGEVNIRNGYLYVNR